jgi:hypothetical protein
VLKKCMIGFAFVALMPLSHASVSKASAAGSRTLAAGQEMHLLGAAEGVISDKPEFATLLCLGTIFVGSAALFSVRRPTA